MQLVSCISLVGFAVLFEFVLVYIADPFVLKELSFGLYSVVLVPVQLILFEPIINTAR